MELIRQTESLVEKIQKSMNSLGLFNCNTSSVRDVILFVNASTYFVLAGNKKGFHCGGSLINQRYVLTAAHCIGKVPATWKLISVRLGEWDTTTDQDCDDSFTNERVCNDPHVDISVEEQLIHEDYLPNSKNQHNDIALLRLSRNVRYTDYIRPVCLPWDSNLKNIDLSGTSLDVAGWGKTETSSTSTRKLKVAVNAYSNSKCQGVYSPSNIQIIDSQVRFVLQILQLKV